jgi:thiamine-phosphate pyrophosphorylase
MMLPRLLVPTDRRQTSRPLWEVVELVLCGGAQCILFREKDLPDNDRFALGHHVARKVQRLGGLLIVASDAKLAMELGADAVHFAADDIVDDVLPFGVSCHSAEDLVKASRRGAVYATLSPMFPSVSKPGYGPALGLESLAGAPLPVYALGGVDETNARSCIEAGASGVAVMGALMRALDPQAEAEAIMRALQ